MSDLFAFPYLSLEEICDRLDIICSDIDRMNFGAAKEHAVQLQHRVVRMTVRDLEVLPKEEQ